MRRTKAIITYTGPGGEPTMTWQYALSVREQEVADLTNAIRVESAWPADRLFAPLHALSVLPDPDPIFVQWLTQGMFTLTDGVITGTQEAYVMVLRHNQGWWSHASQAQH